MPNHYHVIVQTPRGNLSQAMGWLQVTYTVRYNRRHERSGHLFQGRYGAQVVDADEYAQELVRYLHLNPVRGKKSGEVISINRRKELNTYEWSSHRAYSDKEKKPEWLSLNWLSYWGETTTTSQKNYRAFMDEAFEKPLDNLWDKIQGGLVLGNEKFLKKVKALLDDKRGSEEIRWVRQMGRDAVRKQIDILRQEEPNRKIEVWIRVRLGGERLTDVGKSLGYQDGSGVLQTIKRLEMRAKDDTILADKLQSLRKRFELSSVKS